MQFRILNLSENSETFASTATDTSPQVDSIEDIIARGAASATETETAPEPSDVLITETPKRRGRKTKAEKEAEEAAAQAKAELDVFFSPQGIGAVWTNGLNAFYVACGAESLKLEEAEMHARVFATWARYRLPASASQYQPDLLLAATFAMTTLPRMQPIARTTAPLWRRVVARVGSVIRRKKAQPGKPNA